MTALPFAPGQARRSFFLLLKLATRYVAPLHTRLLKEN
jgi:hypothetical protein